MDKDCVFISFLEKIANLPKRLFKRDDLKTILDTVIKETENTTIPMLDGFVKEHRSYKMTSPDTIKLSRVHDTLFDKKSNFILTSLKGMTNLLELAKELRKTLDKNFVPDNDMRVLTYSQAQRIQIIHAINFCSRYARKLMSYFLLKELQEHSVETKDLLTQAEIEYVESMSANYFNLLASFVRKSPQEIVRLLEEIPTITATPATHESIRHLHGPNKLLPVRIGFLPAEYSPIPVIVRWVAEYQHARFLEAQEELKMANMSLTLLNSRITNSDIPTDVEYQVRITKDRITVLNAQIQKYIAEMEG